MQSRAPDAGRGGVAGCAPRRAAPPRPRAAAARVASRRGPGAPGPRQPLGGDEAEEVLVLRAAASDKELEPPAVLRTDPLPPAADPPGEVSRLEAALRLQTAPAAGEDALQPVAGEPAAAAAPAAPPWLERAAPYLLLNLGTALFGTNQVVIKWAEQDASAPAVNAVRFAVAAAVFLPVAVRGLRRGGDLVLSACELGLWLFLGYQAQAVGLAQTTAAHGAFYGIFTVLAVPLLVGLSGRTVPAATWGSGVLALAGVSLLTSGGGEGGANAGDLWCIASALVFGMHKFRTEDVTNRFLDSDSTKELMAIQLVVLAAASALCLAPELRGVWEAGGAPGLAAWSQGLPWPTLVYMGVATTALTLWIEIEAMKKVSAPTAALIYSAEPVWGAGFAWFALDERWGAAGWVGAALIVAASLGSQLGGDGVERVAAAAEDDAKAKAD